MHDEREREREREREGERERERETVGGGGEDMVIICAPPLNQSQVKTIVRKERLGAAQ
jgi:hypothetical protein